MTLIIFANEQRINAQQCASICKGPMSLKKRRLSAVRMLQQSTTP